MSDKLIDYTRTKTKIAGDIGLELEVEPLPNRTLPVINTGNWETKSEGSLRNGGMEYITKTALKKNLDYSRRIKELTDQLNDNIADVNSFRTSLHVHLNMKEKTLTEVWTICTAYWLVENLLFEYCGEDRKSNHFCLRLKDAEGIINHLRDAIEMPNPLLDFSDNLRYGGLNLAALYKFGSLEFRGMRGTIDPVVIETWSTALYELSRLSTTYFNNPQEVMDFYYYHGHEELINVLFPKKLNLFLKGMKNSKDMIDENAYRLIGFAYKCNWKNYTEQLKNRAETKPKLKSRSNRWLDAIAEPVHWTDAINF